MTKPKSWFSTIDRMELICGVVILGVFISFVWRSYVSSNEDSLICQIIWIGSPFQLLETILLLVALFLITVYAFLKAKKVKYTFKSVVSILGVLFIHAIVIGFHIFYYGFVTKITNFVNLPESTISHWQEIVERNDTDAKYKAAFSKLIAREKFIKHVDILRYIDEEGQIRTFDPDVNDINTRYNSLHLKLKIVPSIRIQIYIWSGVLLLSLVSGIFILKKQINYKT